MWAIDWSVWMSCRCHLQPWSCISGWDTWSASCLEYLVHHIPSISHPWGSPSCWHTQLNLIHPLQTWSSSPIRKTQSQLPQTWKQLGNTKLCRAQQFPSKSLEVLLSLTVSAKCLGCNYVYWNTWNNSGSTEVLGNVLKCFEAHWSWWGDDPFFADRLQCQEPTKQMTQWKRQYIQWYYRFLVDNIWLGLPTLLFITAGDQQWAVGSPGELQDLTMCYTLQWQAVGRFGCVGEGQGMAQCRGHTGKECIGCWHIREYCGQSVMSMEWKREIREREGECKICQKRIKKTHWRKPVFDLTKQ